MSIAGKFGAGFQVQTGKRFALAFEGGTLPRFDFDGFSVYAKVGLTWGSK